MDGWRLTTIINYVVWNNNVMTFLIITRNDGIGWLGMKKSTVGDRADAGKE